MVFYIRFLKTPTIKLLSKGQCLVKSLVTITTDLGDGFYGGEVVLYACLDTHGDSKVCSKSWTWKVGMRCLLIEVPIKASDLIQPTRLRISGGCLKGIDEVYEYQMPKIVGAWSDDFSASMKTHAGAKNHIERRLGIGEDNILRVYEETGESIARHIWDAGIALVGHIRNTVEAVDGKGACANLRSLLSSHKSRSLQVIELGSGCGIVGIAVAQLVPNCHVLLTDLPEAMEILDVNIQKLRLAKKSQIERILLDWDQELPAPVQAKIFDLIILSDCTYNSDSLPALVRILSALLSQSQNALVVVAMKVRHSSEAAFFDFMDEAGMVTVEHQVIKLPDDVRSELKQALEAVDIYCFNLKLRCNKGGRPLN